VSDPASPTGAPGVEGGPSAAEAPRHDDQLHAGEVRTRAVAGAVVDLTRGGGMAVIALIGTAVLAHMLTPRDFGLIAFGATLTMVAGFLANGGMGAALIRRAEQPDRKDLKALLAFQTLLNSALAGVMAAVTIPFGELGSVTRVMVLSLPIVAFQAPGAILLERRLEYRALALVDVIETLVYYTWAIVAVSQGAGVWGLVTGGVVRDLAGTCLLLAIVPTARMIPSPSWTRVRALLGFGFRVQAVGFLHLVRDQGLNLGVAAVGGVAVLGVWSVTYRILQIPLLFFNSLWRVSYPSMSRLIAANEDPTEIVERVVALVAVGSGLIFCPLVASARDLVPVVLGSRWAAAANPLAPACLGLMIGSSISVALVGYLWAVGDAAVPARAALITIPLIAVVMLPLLPEIGATAAGISWLVTGVVEGAVVFAGARKHLEISILGGLGPPVVAAVCAGALGWIVGWWIGPRLGGALAAGALAELAYVAALWLWRRSDLLDVVALSSRGVRRTHATASLPE
jgi:O-antigen/teichoic acid export membrane protein